jgi:hypothetical protein
MTTGKEPGIRKKPSESREGRRRMKPSSWQLARVIDKVVLKKRR